MEYTLFQDFADPAAQGQPSQVVPQNLAMGPKMERELVT